MVDLQMTAMRDALRGLRSDVEDLRRRASTGTFASWTPTLTATVTNPNIGADGAVYGYYSRMGDVIVVERLELSMSGAGTAAGSGTYRLALPTPAEARSSYAPCTMAVIVRGGTKYLRYAQVEGAYLTFVDSSLAPVTNTVPHTWASGDTMTVGSFAYRAA